jgi:alanine racemase
MSAAESIAPAEPIPPETIITAGPPAAEAGGILTVDLTAVEANWKALAHRAMPAECGAVIKADGYGCGIEPVASQLAKAGCNTLFVADLSEARRVRATVAEPAVYVLNGLMPGTAPTYADLNVRPVIGSMTELAEWDAFVSTSGWRGGAALHVDTGMNRLGITVEEAAALAPRIRAENHGITLLLSHFASAELPDDPLNEKQIATFREIRLLYRGIPSSLANSSGVFLGSAAHCDMERPGVALFGVNPTPGRPNPMRPVITLQGRIVGLRHINRGDTVGYNAVWTAKRATRLAVVGVGYADGYLRAASASDTVSGGDAIVAGKRCTLAGRVSMDLLTIDITEVAEGAVKRGDLATLIGGDITVDEFAKAAGTIGYEVLTSLGRRYHRIYKVA